MPSPAKVRPQRADNVIALPANTSLPQPHPAGKPHHHAHTPVPGYAGTLPRATAGFEFRLSGRAGRHPAARLDHHPRPAVRTTSLGRHSILGAGRDRRPCDPPGRAAVHGRAGRSPHRQGQGLASVDDLPARRGDPAYHRRGPQLGLRRRRVVMFAESGKGANEMSALPNVVLVHGAWADGSSWSAVIERLQADGYNATAPQFPLTALADDVARLRQVLARQNGPTVVAGHSYGGQIMTALGTDAPNVVGLVYIAAFGLDEGESIGALLGQGPPSPALAHLEIDQQGFAWLPEDDFVHYFAADVDPVKARVMHAVQQPLAGSTLQEVMGVPAWKSLPSWFLVADGDQAIPPDAERQLAGRMGATTVEVPTNHVAMVSHPDDVVNLIKRAAEAVPVAS